MARGYFNADLQHDQKRRTSQEMLLLFSLLMLITLKTPTNAVKILSHALLKAVALFVPSTRRRVM
jgi:hypothetical protein